MKDSTTRIDEDHSLVDHCRLSDDKVSPTVVSCDTATVTSYETTNENGTTTLTTSSTTSSSNSSEAAVVVAHRSWMARNTSKRNNHNTIPKAITLTTTTAIAKQLPQSPTNATFKSNGSSINSTLSKLTTDELYQQLQKRLRPEDIPSIPTLSSRNQRRRYNIPSITTSTTDAMVMQASFRPVCNFVNYMGTKSRTISGTSSSSIPASNDCHTCYYHDHPSRLGTFRKSLITLHDDVDEDNNFGDDDDDHMGIATFDSGTHHFASIVSVNGNDEDDMFLLSNLDTLNWGILPTEVEGIEVGHTKEEDVFLRNEADTMSIEEPNRYTTSSWSLPNVYGGTANKTKHFDQTKTFDDHNYDKALYDSFTMQHSHDDIADLFDFEL